MSLALLKEFDDSKPFRDIILNIWKNGFEFVKTNRALYQYAEQFSNSPYYDLVDHKEIEKHFEPMIKVLQKGIEQKVIKDVSFEILAAFMFYPIMILSNSRISKTNEINDSTIESAFQLA